MDDNGTLPDPDLIDFRIRRHDLSGNRPKETAGDWNVPAYSPLWSGLWLGYGPGASARARQGAGPDGRGGLVLSLDPGPSPWMSVEMGLDGEGLARSGAALITIEAAASPLASVNVVLRMPCRDMPSGFWDTRPQTVILDADVTCKSLAFFPQPQVADFAPHDGFANPVLIAFLPLRRTELFLSALTVGPAA